MRADGPDGCHSRLVGWNSCLLLETTVALSRCVGEAFDEMHVLIKKNKKQNQAFWLDTRHSMRYGVLCIAQRCFNHLFQTNPTGCRRVHWGGGRGGECLTQLTQQDPYCVIFNCMVCCSGAGGWLPGQRVVISSLGECSEAALIWIFQQWHTQAEESLSVFPWQPSWCVVSSKETNVVQCNMISLGLQPRRGRGFIKDSSPSCVYYCFITNLITICSCRHSNTESCVDTGWHAINILMLCVHQYTQFGSIRVCYHLEH